MRRIAALATAGVVLALLVLAQLLLPGIAAQRLRDRLSKSGHVLSVSVEAFPAIELLWHRADKVVVRLASYRAPPKDVGNLLAEAGDVGTLDATTGVFDSGLLTLRNATLHKRGDRLTGTATVTQQDLRSAAPFLDAVEPVASSAGALTLRGTATLLGVTATVDATVATAQGRLIVQPDVPFGALATLTLFENPHVAVDGVSAGAAPAGGFTVTATGQLR